MSDPKGSSLSLTSSEDSSVAISLICRWHLVLFPSCQPRQEISLYFPASGRDRELDRSQEARLVPEPQTASQRLSWKRISTNFYSGIHLFKRFAALGVLIASNCSALALWREELGKPSSADKGNPNQAPLPGQERGCLSSSGKEGATFLSPFLLIAQSQPHAALCRLWNSLGASTS